MNEKLFQALYDALKDAIAKCSCGGTGIDYTLTSDEDMGLAPGTSKIPCPRCKPWRDVIEKVGNEAAREQTRL